MGSSCVLGKGRISDLLAPSDPPRYTQRGARLFGPVKGTATFRRFAFVFGILVSWVAAFGAEALHKGKGKD